VEWEGRDKLIQGWGVPVIFEVLFVSGLRQFLLQGFCYVADILVDIYDLYLLMKF